MSEPSLEEDKNIIIKKDGDKVRAVSSVNQTPVKQYYFFFTNNNNNFSF